MTLYLWFLYGLIISYLVSQFFATHTVGFIIMAIFIVLSVVVGGIDYIASGFMDEKK